MNRDIGLFSQNTYADFLPPGISLLLWSSQILCGFILRGITKQKGWGEREAFLKSSVWTCKLLNSISNTNYSLLTSFISHSSVLWGIVAAYNILFFSILSLWGRSGLENMTSKVGFWAWLSQILVQVSNQYTMLAITWHKNSLIQKWCSKL